MLIPPPPELLPNEKAPWINIPSSTFAADWSKMVDNSSHSDMVLKLATKTYHAHRYVLACGSDVSGQLHVLCVRKQVRGKGLNKRSREEKITQERFKSRQVDDLLLLHFEEKLVDIQAINSIQFQLICIWLLL